MFEPPVEIAAPDIGAYRQGNTGIPYVTTFESGRAGPHAVITALVHGNELCGALALAQLFELGIRPRRGRLSLAFVNTAAFERFDPDQPKASRYLDEDLNRVWDPAALDGPRESVELARAREIRPLIESADALLDLHSMQLAAPPLLLCGLAAKGRRLARAIGYPALVVADAGHRGGPRMRDFGAFAEPSSPRTAMLVECGQHWAAGSVEVALATCARFLAAFDLIAPAALDRLGARVEFGAATADQGHPRRDRERRPVPVHRGFPGSRGGPEAGHGDRSRRRPAGAHALRRLRADHAVAPAWTRPDRGQARPVRGLTGPHAPAFLEPKPPAGGF